MRYGRDTLADVRTINEQMFDMRSDYDAAQTNRFYKTPQGVPIQGASGDWHFRNEIDYFTVMERCQHIARNDKVVAQGIRTLVRNVIQDGFVPVAATDDDATNDLLDQMWQDWSGDKERVDYKGEFNWHWIEKLGAAACVTSGDFSLSPLTSGQLQAFEGYRMRSPSPGRNAKATDNTMICGVEKYANDRVFRYWITKKDYNGNGGQLFKQDDLRSFNAFEMSPITGRLEEMFFHVRLPSRFTQTRGVSPLAPVVITTGMLADSDFAALVKTQIANYFAVFREIPESYLGEIPQAGKTEDDPYGEGTRQRLPIRPGAEYQSRIKGEKLMGFSPNIPSPGYFEQSHMLLSYISVNLDLPLMLLLMDASETNFSGWRGAFDQAKLRFQDFQRDLCSMFHCRIRRWKILQWLAQDASLRRTYEAMGERLFRAEWHFPKWPFIQPLDDTAAEVMQVRNGLTSMRRLCRTRNIEYETLATEIIEDTKLIYTKAIEAAAEINKQFPEAKVDWREVYYPPPADSVQVALSPLQTQQSKDQQQTQRSASNDGGRAKIPV